MRTDVEALENALQLFVWEDGEWKLRLSSSELFSQSLMPANRERPNISDVRFLLGKFHEDVWNILTIAHRIEWMKQRALEEADFRDRWSSYVALDIQSFFVELRAALDYLTQVIRIFAPNPGEVTDSGSFRKLLNWSANNPERLQRDVTELLADQREWFMNFRGVRDHILHRGGHALVFGNPEDGILFQVMGDQLRGSIRHEKMMFNANAAHFDKYAALHISRLFSFADDLGSVYLAILGSDAVDTRLTSRGIAVVQYWLDQYRHELANAAV